jgi:putative flippase GtrA
VSAATFGRVVRCLTVSVGTTLLSAAVLVALALAMGVPAGVANVAAVCCGVGPSYFANRRWVWRRDGRGSVSREAAPFVALSAAGLVASTVAVARVAALSHTWPTSWRAVALPATNLAVFGALWCVQFMILDRVIFTAPRAAASAQLGGVQS